MSAATGNEAAPKAGPPVGSVAARGRPRDVVGRPVRAEAADRPVKPVPTHGVRARVRLRAVQVVDARRPTVSVRPAVAARAALRPMVAVDPVAVAARPVVPVVGVPPVVPMPPVGLPAAVAALLVAPTVEDGGRLLATPVAVALQPPIRSHPPCRRPPRRPRTAWPTRTARCTSRGRSRLVARRSHRAATVPDR